MSYEIAIMNPRPRKAVKKSRRKRNTREGSAMKRNARGQFVKRHNPRRRHRAKAREHNPRRRRRRHNPTMMNPRRRRRRNPIGFVTHGQKRRRRRVYRLGNPRRRRRHNPRGLGGILNYVTQSAIPAAAGAVATIGLDVALGYLPLPAMLTSGMPRHALRIVAAPILAGFVGSKLLGQEKGAKAAVGAMSVTLYALAKDLLGQFAPSIAGSLANYPEYQMGFSTAMSGYDPARVIGAGAYMPHAGVGAYMAHEGVGDYEF